MVASLAYTEESIGAWNETRWFDDEFSQLLLEAQATLDVEARRSIFCKMEDIMQDRGPDRQPLLEECLEHHAKEFENVESHPTAYYLMNKVWKNA